LPGPQVAAMTGAPVVRCVDRNQPDIDTFGERRRELGWGLYQHDGRQMDIKIRKC